jgi:hypothetical protein
MMMMMMMTIPDDYDRDGPQNTGSLQTPDTANSPRRFHKILVAVKAHEHISAGIMFTGMSQCNYVHKI